MYGWVVKILILLHAVKNRIQRGVGSSSKDRKFLYVNEMTTSIKDICPRALMF